MRRAAKVDRNQSEIVEALRKVGAFVEPKLSRVGEGCPDLLICFRGVWRVLEVKDWALPPSGRKLTPKEAAWGLAAATVGGEVPVIESVADALRVIGVDGTMTKGR